MSCLIKRLITLTVPVKYQAINLFDDNGIDITATCLFSWSIDGACWTNFVSYEQYTMMAPNIEVDYFLRILINTGFSKLALDNTVVDCYTICLYNENPYLTDLCTNQSIDFYANLDCSLLMYQQLSNLICCMIGIPCYYFRVLPDQNTADFTFKEYVLHNVVDMKYLKLICPDGTLPSSKPQMTEFDFDWETDWEVELSKTAFAKAFGDTVFPKQRDIIWIPLMGRMWEVNSAYDEKNESFMWRPVTWKLGLVKWNDKTNVSQGEFEEIIDSWATNRMESFMGFERNEQEQQSGVNQIAAPTFNADNLYVTFLEDAIRTGVTLSEKENVIKTQINHNAAVVSRNMYNFKGIDSIVKYVNMTCGDNGTLLFIMDTNNIQGTHNCFNENDEFVKTIFKAGTIEINLRITRELPESRNRKTGWMYKYYISFNGMECELCDSKNDPNKSTYTGIYEVQCRWNRNNFTTEMNVIPYIQTVPAGTPPYRIRPEMHILDFVHPVCTMTNTYNNDFVQTKPVDIILSPAPVGITNIKLFNVSLSDNDMAKESIKYTTANSCCVINDVARPFIEETGFNVR